VVLGLAGLLLGTVLIGWYGFGHILRATASVGLAGFIAVCLWQLVLFALLGLCWFVLRPAAADWRLPVLTWGRMVRDAAGQCLPFSLVGGFVLGARAITLEGVLWPEAAASTVVDLSAEFVAQIGLVLIGVALLSVRAPDASIIRPICIGLAAAIAAASGLVWLQRGAGGPLMRVSRRLLGSWSRDADISAIQARLTGIYDSPWRVGLCTVLHLAGWFGTGVASWIAFRLLGAHIDFAAALGIEALLHAVLALAVLVPGYAGVQEAAYAGVGALFGQPPELSLSVSLLRRARDVALGVPILLLWQGAEWRMRQKERKASVFFSEEKKQKTFII
jgi:putative membrane protein